MFADFTRRIRPAHGARRQQRIAPGTAQRRVECRLGYWRADG